MKVYALNASPRKGWNCDQLLDRFIEGVRDTAPEIEVEKVNIYDLDYKGCRSCFACMHKSTENGFCLYRDGAYELLRNIKTGDGLVFSAPIYYSEVPSQMRALIERLFHPGNAPHEIPVTMIYTMNQPEDVSERRFRPHMDGIGGTFRGAFHTEPDEVDAYFTLHWQHPEDYNWPMELYDRKVEYKEKQWPVDLQNCYDAGVRFAGRVRETVDRRNAEE